MLRMENILRRNSPTPRTHKDVFEFSGITIHLDSHLITKDNKNIELSPKEYELLQILLKNKGKILNRDFLYEKVWGEIDVPEKVLETINVHIARLRKKLSPDLIRTIKLI